MKRIDPQFLELLDMVMHRRPDQSAEYSLAEAKCMYSNLTQRDPIVEEDEPDYSTPEVDRLKRDNALLESAIGAYTEEIRRLKERNDFSKKALENMVHQGFETERNERFCRYCGQLEGTSHLGMCALNIAQQTLNQEKD